MSYKIYANKDNLLAQKAQIVAKYSGLELETTPNFIVGTDNTTDDFLKKNPLGKIPVLETDEGNIWESNAIIRFLARADENTSLYGSNDYEKALVDQWLDFTLSEIDLPARVWILPILGLLPDADAGSINRAKSDIRKVLTILNDHLKDQTFLVGERLTLADISVSLHLRDLYTLVLDPGYRKVFVNANRWFLTCVHQPHFLEVLGELTLCTKMAVAKLSEKPKEEKKEKKPQEPKKPQETQKPKEEKPKEEKKPKKKDDDEEEDEFKEEKPRSLLDLLPKSSLDLEEWKRFYSNNNSKEAMEWFWPHFDSEGWSLWFCEYKYSDELESLLKTCNLIGGWFQRLDRLRKYAFGNAIIFKHPSDAYHEISCCWIIRSKEIPAELKECDDYELYEWKRVENHEDPEVRKKVAEYWSWEGDFGGRKFIQGKVFK